MSVLQVLYLTRKSYPKCTGVMLSLWLAGLLYTAMPRGDMVGTATFYDKKSNLQGEIIFGKVPGKEEDPLLQRTDSFRLSICEVDAEEGARPPSPDAAAPSSQSVSRSDPLPC